LYDRARPGTRGGSGAERLYKRQALIGRHECNFHCRDDVHAEILYLDSDNQVEAAYTIGEVFRAVDLEMVSCRLAPEAPVDPDPDHYFGRRGEIKKGTVSQETIKAVYASWLVFYRLV
jgi:hypothetical protein